jgi:predicted metallo-beta-lactamase superfamily hydrolase
LGSSYEEAEQIYAGKTVLVKDYRNAINFNQRRRGWMFQRFVRKLGSKCEVADGKVFEFGGTKLRFSPPVPHGEDETALGWVLMTGIESQEEKFLHSSDVQGPMSKVTTRMILREKPDLLILGGPPTYLEGIRVEKAAIQKGIENAARIATKIPKVVFEHHLLRSEDWAQRAKKVLETANKAEHDLMTAAEYSGDKPSLLEARRERLYGDQPPSEAFLKWTELSRDKQRLKPPPI